MIVAVDTECTQRDEFPEHLVHELELLRQQEADELLQKELERNTCKVLCHSCCTWYWDVGSLVG